VLARRHRRDAYRRGVVAPPGTASTAAEGAKANADTAATQAGTAANQTGAAATAAGTAASRAEAARVAAVGAQAAAETAACAKGVEAALAAGLDAALTTPRPELTGNPNPADASLLTRILDTHAELRNPSVRRNESRTVYQSDGATLLRTRRTEITPDNTELREEDA